MVLESMSFQQEIMLAVDLRIQCCADQQPAWMNKGVHTLAGAHHAVDCMCAVQ